MNPERYRRQILVKELGAQGQDTLSKKHAVVIGGGGLGSNSANLLVRAGIGSIDIVDYDVVDITNLHRTALFTEDDVGKSKAKVLEKKLHQSNTEVVVRGVEQKVTKETITSIVDHADIVLDGTDSLAMRFLLNDIAVKQGIPWVYAGVYATVGMVMGVLPKQTPCFKCISPVLPSEDASETPVLGTLPGLIAAVQCNEAMKFLLGMPFSGLLIYDSWSQCFDQMVLERNLSCSCCGKGMFEFLEK